MKKIIDLIINNIPLSYRQILKNSFNGASTALDVGCGDGAILKLILPNKHGIKITGIDIHKPSLEIADKSGVYTKLSVQNLTSSRWRGIDDKIYDLVFCSQFIEHIEKEEGEKLLKRIDLLAKKKIVVTTPNGFLNFRPMEEDEINNPFQVHKSGWTVWDFKKRGYKVYGQGAKWVYGEDSFVRLLPNILRQPIFLLSFLLSPFYYFYPQYSYNLIAIKEKK